VRAFRAIAAVTALCCGACSKPAPSPPTVSSGDTVTITGREHLGWDQLAASQAELDTIGYYLYVDANPKQLLTGVSCAPGSTGGTFFCRVQLPTLSAGAHTLQATSFYTNDPSNESAKSGPLQVIVQSLVAGGLDAPAISREPRSSGQATASTTQTWPAGLIRVADGLDRPSDLAFTPDSRLWIAERSGRIRVLQDGALARDPAVTLDPRLGDAMISLAPDPHFAGSHFIFAIYTERSRAGLTFAVARYREAAGTLADRIVILDNVRASPDARATLRFGPDGKLYAAFDAGGDAALAQDPASFSGKILRLNPDGTTPDDAPGKSPIWVRGLASPRGVVWPRLATRPWVADESGIGDLPWTPTPESLLVVKDDLLVGSMSGLTRSHIQSTSPPRLSAARDVLRNVRVHALAVAPDGGVYIATDTSIGRLQEAALLVTRKWPRS
jgi:glucose/arabinose dehydrogenase